MMRCWLTSPYNVVMGMAYVYEVPRAEDNFILWENFSTSYYSISLLLNITLTLMIVTRLILHRRNVRKAIGASESSSGLYTAIVTMLIELYALYAIAYLLFLVLWVVSSPVEDIFSSALSSAQVRVVRLPFSLVHCSLGTSPSNRCYTHRSSLHISSSSGSPSGER